MLAKHLHPLQIARVREKNVQSVYCTVGIQHKQGQMGVDLGNGSSECGRSLCQWKADGSLTQHWWFTRVD